MVSVNHFLSPCVELANLADLPTATSADAIVQEFSGYLSALSKEPATSMLILRRNASLVLLPELETDGIVLR